MKSFREFFNERMVTEGSMSDVYAYWITAKGKLVPIIYASEQNTHIGYIMAHPEEFNMTPEEIPTRRSIDLP